MNESDAFDLRAPVPADSFLPQGGIPGWIWLLAALALVAAVTAIFIHLRLARSRGNAVDSALARRRALAELDEIDTTARVSTVATAVSLALRRFLADTLDDPALFETHEEFLAREQRLEVLPPGQRDESARYFASLARLKYGPDTSSDPAALVQQARDLLLRLHPPAKAIANQQ